MARFVQKDRGPLLYVYIPSKRGDKKFIIWHLNAFILETNKKWMI